MKTALLFTLLFVCAFDCQAQRRSRSKIPGSLATAREASVGPNSKVRRVSRLAAEAQGPAKLTPQYKSRRPRFDSLPIRRVVLYSNGVAYIERRGTVSNHAEISLEFKQSQVDDVLKSMVVLDMGKGRIAAVSYNFFKVGPSSTTSARKIGPTYSFHWSRARRFRLSNRFKTPSIVTDRLFHFPKI